MINSMGRKTASGIVKPPWEEQHFLRSEHCCCGGLQGFVVACFKICNLFAEAKVGPDALGCLGGEARKEGGLAEELEDGVGQFTRAFFRDQEAIEPVSDSFRNSAVTGGDDGEPCGHGFEHGVRNAFLIGGVREFAGMEEGVAAVEFSEELILIEPATDFDMVAEAKGIAPGKEFFFHGTAAADDKF